MTISWRSLLWRAISLVLVAAAGWMFARNYLATLPAQLRTLTWQETSGTIEQSSVVGEKDEAYRAGEPNFRVRYRYEAGGRTQEGTRYRLGAESIQGKLYAEWLEICFPPGKVVPVWIDPADPARAVLVRGMTGEDGLMLMLLTPLAVFTLMVIGSAIAPGRAQRERPETAGLHFAVSESRAALNVAPIEPWLCATGIALVVPPAFGLVICLAEAALRKGRLVDLSWWLWPLILVIVLASARAAVRWIRSPNWQVVIDRERGEIALPERATRDFEAPATLRLADVRGFDSVIYEQPRRNSPPRVFHATIVEWEDARGRHRAPVYTDENPAVPEKAAAWLNGQFRRLLGPS